jgi:hypothetical protein
MKLILIIIVIVSAAFSILNLLTLITSYNYENERKTTAGFRLAVGLGMFFISLIIKLLLK